MKTVISRRAIARLVSFSLAIIAVLGAADLIYMRRLREAERQIEYGYMQAVDELASSADKLSSTLSKGLYAATPTMMARLSSELISEANTAKTALTKLPVSNINLEKTEKFFSQIGNYAYSLAEQAAMGGTPEYEDYSNMQALCENAENLSKQLWQIRSRFSSNDKTISELFKELENSSDSFITEGFSGMEEGFENTPKLIYDGPFSDHILEREPRLTENAPEVTRDEAVKKAAAYCHLEDWELHDCQTGEDGKMPSYCFYADGLNVAVTKKGGFISYMLRSREPSTKKITPEKAESYATSYLESLGIKNMEKTYYETYNNVTTINYAYEAGDVTCYTDLIKVSVALDNGEILGFDARGYIVNHYERDPAEPTLSVQECQEKLSPALEVVKSSLAIIPTDSVDETYCWEFECKTQDERTVLVYVNCETGEEEDILILLEMPDSTLTI